MDDLDNLREDEELPPADSEGKITVRIAIDVDVLEAFKSMGDDWQARINDVLRKWAIEHGLLRK